jgi:hypothetical protein
LIFKTAIFIFNFTIKIPTLNCCYEMKRGDADARTDRAVLGVSLNVVAVSSISMKIIAIKRFGKQLQIQKFGKTIYRSKIVNLRERRGSRI